MIRGVGQVADIKWIVQEVGKEHKNIQKSPYDQQNPTVDSIGYRCAVSYFGKDFWVSKDSSQTIRNNLNTQHWQ